MRNDSFVAEVQSIWLKGYFFILAL